MAVAAIADSGGGSNSEARMIDMPMGCSIMARLGGEIATAGTRM